MKTGIIKRRKGRDNQKMTIEKSLMILGLSFSKNIVVIKMIISMINMNTIPCNDKKAI
ncbi:MAG: hypothetical protein QXI58_06950 [Candidatus Micrarchaeia archaeon]